MKWWFVFCIFGLAICPVREVDEQSSRSAKLAEELLLMDFVVWLVTVNPSGRRISVKTAMKYVSAVAPPPPVRRWVDRWGAGSRAAASHGAGDAAGDA